ncbi:MAG TPA: HAMP domain-containing sensor histidine kinase [Gammaproteobacteria bacterium]|nr:HAMP domain-containing sensor histidine kinase [Gammaproteobacteria bacterium]
MSGRHLNATLITINAILVWAAYSCLYTALEANPGTTTLAGFFSLAGETGLDIVATLLAIRLWRKTEKSSPRNILLIFFLSFISAAAADCIYNIALNLFQFQYINPIIISLFDFPFALFLFFQVMVWGWILFADRKALTKIVKSTYIPYAIVSVLMFIMFMFVIPWKIKHFSLLGIFHAVDTILEVTGFLLATICLARAKTRLVRFATTGYLLIVSSDFVIRYHVVSGSVPYLSPMESTWILGLLLICLGFFFTQHHKKNELFELLPINSLQSQMAMWLLILWLLSVFSFVGLYYFFVQEREYNLNLIIKNLLSLLVPFSTIAIVSSNYLSIKLSSPFSRLENIINGFIKTDHPEVPKSENEKNNFIFEFVSLEKFVFDAFFLIQKKNLLEIEFAQKATQVSHDIKSPLAALDVVVSSFKELPEEGRILARSAISRIKDIANDLLHKNRDIIKKNLSTSQSQQDKAHEPESSQLLLSLIEDIVSEKRIQLTTRPDIKIIYDIALDSYGLFSKVQPTEFKRLISNLLNNSIESLDQSGKIQIMLISTGSNIELRITDNGCGIPPELLKKLGQRGQTQGKAEGSGLGIFHARSNCEAVGGSLHIDSEVGKGTSVIITLPKANPPDWFIPELKLAAGSVVFILDDDFSIKEVWRQRFDQINAKDHRIEVHYFSTPDEFESNFNILDKSKSVHYLLDYEIMGEKKTGLDVAEKLCLGSQAILITSHWEEASIQTRCSEQRIHLIPKGLAGFVPIKILSEKKSV